MKIKLPSFKIILSEFTWNLIFAVYIRHRICLDEFSILNLYNAGIILLISKIKMINFRSDSGKQMCLVVLQLKDHPILIGFTVIKLVAFVNALKICGLNDDCKFISSLPSIIESGVSGIRYFKFIFYLRHEFNYLIPKSTEVLGIQYLTCYS